MYVCIIYNIYVCIIYNIKMENLPTNLEHMPTELKIEIFKKLHVYDLITLRTTSKEYKDVIDSILRTHHHKYYNDGVRNSHVLPIATIINEIKDIPMVNIPEIVLSKCQRNLTKKYRYIQEFYRFVLWILYPEKYVSIYFLDPIVNGMDDGEDFIRELERLKLKIPRNKLINALEVSKEKTKFPSHIPNPNYEILDDPIKYITDVKSNYIIDSDDMSDLEKYKHMNIFMDKYKMKYPYNKYYQLMRFIERDFTIIPTYYYNERMTLHGVINNSIEYYTEEDKYVKGVKIINQYKLLLDIYVSNFFPKIKDLKL